MDFFSKAYSQVTDTLKGMSPATQIASLLMLVLIGVGIAFLFQFQVTAGDEFLLGGRSFMAEELTRAEAAFAEAGLSGSNIADGNRIRIPKGKKDLYLAALAKSNALPADFYKYLDEAAASDNPFSSAKSLEVRRSNAKQKELALIISHMPGIQRATVQYDEEVQNPLTRTKKKTAMVAVWPMNSRLDDEVIRSIQNVIATAYAGLDRQQISITDMSSGLTHGGMGEHELGAQENAYVMRKTQFEKSWKQKINDQLSWLPGAIVNVNVELDSQIQSTSQKVIVDAKPTTLSSSERTRESSTTQKQIGGRPGAEPNGVGNSAVAINTSSAAPETTSNENQSEVKNVAGHEQSMIVKAGMTPTRVTAAILIPQSHFLKVWQSRNPGADGAAPKTPDPAELTKIETEVSKKVNEVVVNLLPPVPDGTNPYPQIKVESYVDFAQPAPPAIAISDTILAWLDDNWQTLGMIVVGLFALMMVRSMVGSVNKTAPAASASSTAAAAGHGGHGSSEAEHADEADESPAVISMLKRNFDANTPNLKDELRNLVKDDPDAAATILRNWIGDAA